MYDVRCWEGPRGDKPVKEWLQKLKEANPLAFKRIDRLLQTVRVLGPHMSLPGNKFLGEGLWELRDSGSGPGFRIYYAYSDDQLIILLVAGDKSSQTRDIEKSRKRLFTLYENR